MITSPDFADAMSYKAYKSLLEKLLAEGKTTGKNQSAEFLNYAKINLQRMSRLEKTTLLIPDLTKALQNIQRSYTWLVITEGWCGDAAQNLPVFELIEKACPTITIKIVLRDEHPELIDRYLTNGSRSIPKVICFKKDEQSGGENKEQFVWGPRPNGLQQLVLQWLKGGISKEEKGLLVQKWYNEDKTLSLQKELLNLVNTLL